jgi:hypothetical protein
MTCPSCGAPNHADFSFCLQCGHPLAQAGQESEQVGATRADMMPIEGGTMAMEPLPNTVIPQAETKGGGTPSVRLRVDSGSVDEDVIGLDRPLTVIGRRQGSDVVIHDTNVSRMHAQIKRDGSRLMIEDTNSSNGTIVNDERIERPRELHAGDVIRVGDAVFVFEQDVAALAGDDDLDMSPEGSTMAIDLESPMTSLGGAPELMLPSLGQRPVTPPSTPAPMAASLTPPPSIMDEGHTAFAASAVYQEEDELAPVPQRAAAPEPAPAPPVLVSPLPAAPAPPAPMSSASAANVSDMSVARPPTPAPAGSTSAALESLRRELTEVGQELGAFSGTLGGLADRVDRLERTLDAATGDLASVADAIRGPDAAVLKELQGIAVDIEKAADGPHLDDAIKVLEQLATQPRDIELLLKLSQQAGAIESALRIHGRLVAAAPRLRNTLARLTD